MHEGEGLLSFFCIVISAPAEVLFRDVYSIGPCETYCYNCNAFYLFYIIVDLTWNKIQTIMLDNNAPASYILHPGNEDDI